MSNCTPQAKFLATPLSILFLIVLNPDISKHLQMTHCLIHFCIDIKSIEKNFHSKNFFDETEPWKQKKKMYFQQILIFLFSWNDAVLCIVTVYQNVISRLLFFRCQETSAKTFREKLATKFQSNTQNRFVLEKTTS